VAKQAELGSACGGGDSQGWDQRANLLSMEEPYVGMQTGQARQMKQLQGREQPVETTGCRSEPGQDDAAGCAQKKVLKPLGRRPMVDHLRDQYRASERHACPVLLMVRGTYRYQSHPVIMDGVADADTRNRA